MGSRFMDRVVRCASLATHHIAIVFVAVSTGLSSANAQFVVRGVVYNDSTGAPVRGTVMLVDPSTDSPVAHVVTDTLGVFELKAPAGVYQIAAVRDGFQSTLSAPIHVVSGERMTVRIPMGAGDTKHNIGVTEHVRPDTTNNASKLAAATGSFESRQANHHPGRLFTRDQLESSGARTLGDFLQRQVGIRVIDPASASSMQMSRNSGFAVSNISKTSQCRIGWFVDGHRMDLRYTRGLDPATDALPGMNIESVEALEVFSGVSEMPPEFAEPDLRCGAVVIWTRHGP